MNDGYETVALDHAALDISRRNDVFDRVRELQPDLIINAAGVADVDVCETEKWNAYLVNRDGTKHLAAAASEVNALLVHPSSDLLFDGEKGEPYKEEDPPNPLSIYADTKLAGELAVLSGAPRHLVARCGWLFGPHGAGPLHDLLARAREGREIFAYDDHRAQATHQHDFADAVLELARRNESGVWHVTNAGEATPYDFAREACTILGKGTDLVKPLKRVMGTKVALRPRYSVLDGSKLAAAGVRMRPWVEALREALGDRR
jgi:dTDP-4-dehydrorhamnose reductase